MSNNENNISSSLRYSFRNERIREVCRRAGIVTHDPVFVAKQNASSESKMPILESKQFN